MKASSDASISLVLDGYGEIFSGFDPRSYSEKALSDDFLNVCRKAARGKGEGEGELELRLMLPEGERDTGLEATIRLRLDGYFRNHLVKRERTIKETKKKGRRWFAIGAVCMLVSAYLRSGSITGFMGLTESNFVFHLLIVAFEPAGWFLVWEGLAQILMGSKEHERELAFYKKLAAARIEFRSIREGESGIGGEGVDLSRKIAN